MTRTIIVLSGLLLAAVYLIVPVVSGKTWNAVVSDIERGAREATTSSVRPPLPGTAPAASGGGAAPPPKLTVSAPVVGQTVDTIVATGRFDAIESVEVRSRVSGYLDAVRFKDGDEVKKGDVLFLIDPRPAERALAQAKAELELARTRIANASLDVERARGLVQRRIVSEKTFDDRENVVREGEAQAKIAEERIKSAELDLSYTRITAPVSGRIGRTLVTPGNFITAAGGSSSTSALASIVVQDPIHLYFEITEADALRFKRMAATAAGGSNAAPSGAAASLAAAKVEVQLADEADFSHTGRLDFLDNRFDAGTGSLRVRAVLQNPSRLFTPGQFARVRIQVSAPYAAVMVPDSAIGSDQANRFVLVLGPDDTVVRKPVTLGHLADGLRVVRSGLEPGDWIVTRGLTRARPGQKIEPVRETLKVSSGDAPASAVTR